MLKFSAKKVVFLVLSAKNQISPLFAPLEKFRKNILVASPEKNRSDPHGYVTSVRNARSFTYPTSLKN